MALSLTPLSVTVGVSTVLATVLAYSVFQERPKTGAVAMAASAFALALWGGGQVLVLASETVWPATVGLTITYLGQAIIPPAWYVFGQQYTGVRETVPRWLVGLLAVEPVLVVALGATNGVHELLWVDPAITTGAGGTVLVYEYGIGTVVHVAYAYLLVAVGTRHLVRKFLVSRNVYRARTMLFIFIAVTVVAASAVSFLGLSPLPYLTSAPVLFLGLSIISLLSVVSNRFIAVLPVERVLSMVGSRAKTLAPAARDTAIEEMRSGFVVTDHKNRIVDINPMGKRILGQGDERIVGKELTTVLPPEVFVDENTPFLDPDAVGEFSGLWVEAGEERRCFDAMISPLDTDAEGNLVGRVALIHDVTDRERRKQKLEERTEQLERQNDQLESFASIVSHDLRNPLNVADSRLELIAMRTDGVEESIEAAQDALDRMEDIINDVLTLAQLGQSVSETEPVRIDEIARDAWQNVENPEARLDCQLELEATGDESRLLQLFENFFRNAIEHGREDVTITVGRLRDGFYVADDGPGIPEDHRDDVFDEGFTTSDEGTGFGLSIIDTIVDAHGWSITVSESDDGGARFEITDVIPPREQVARSAT